MAFRSLTLSVFATSLVGLSGTALAGEATQAHVRPSAWNTVSFDIARDVPTRPAEVARPESSGHYGSRIDWRKEINGLSAQEELGPRWSYRLTRAGPALELAALGAGRKERPGLAHVAVDWSF